MTQKILEAAIQVLNGEGYAALGQRRVAAAAGMSLSTLQYHFPTIDDLVRETTRTYMDMFMDKVRALIATPREEPDALLRHLVEYWIEAVRSPNTARGTFESWALAQRHPEVREVIRRGYQFYRSSFVHAIKLINPRLSAVELEARATLIGAQIDGLLLYAFDGSPKIADWDLVTRHCIDSALSLSRV